jgi:hypothetical protein
MAFPAIMQVELAPASAEAAVPPGGPEAAAAVPRWAEAAAVPVVSAGCLSVWAFRADLPLLNSCIRADKTTPPAQHKASAQGCQAGVLMKLRFAFGITELDHGLCDQLPMPSGRQLGILRWCHAINHPPWLVDDNFDLGSASSAVKFHEKGSCRVPPAMLAGAYHWGHGSRIVDLSISACLLELPCQKRVISNSPERLYDFGCCQGGIDGLGTSFMTEEKARHYAKVLSRSMGVTFHAVRSRQGRLLAVQIPSDDCEILATIRPPRGVNGSRPLRREQPRRVAKRYRSRERGFDSTAAEMRARSCREP